VTFESVSKLVRIEKNAFSFCGLIEIIIPASVQVLGDKCFSGCRQLRSISFEQRSRLRQVGQNAFGDSSVVPMFPTQNFSLR
jgi:hypothetical protein